MINYSVYMYSSPFMKDETPKAHARNQISEIWTLEKFAKHIADHNGVFSRGTVKGVLSNMCECLVEQLLNGNKIQLGELGTFGITLSSEGAESVDKFSSKNITGVNIRFTPGEDFADLISRAEFNRVSSRVAQQATLKAEKAGESTVDLAAAKAAASSAPTTGPDDEETEEEDGSGTTI